MKRRIVAMWMVVVLVITALPTTAITASAADENLVTAGAIGGNCSAAVTKNGDLYCWGSNNWGQIGNGKSGGTELTPVKVLESVESVTLGSTISAAVTKNGDLYCWGGDEYNLIGNGTLYGYQLTPVKVLENVESVFLGMYHSAAVTKNGDLYCWGCNGNGQIGNGKSGGNQSTPVKVLENVESVSIGDYHSAAITKDGDLYCWGDNYYGEIGNGKSSRTHQPTPVKVLENVGSVSLGINHSAAVTKNGDLYCWGDNEDGQIGNGKSGGAQLTPVKILENVESVSLGGYYSYSAAITKDGDLYCWGDNEGGQIGNGKSSGIQPTPVKVLENVESVSIHSYTYHSAAVTSDGDLYCWGSNALGQIGNGKQGEYQLTPLKVLENVESVLVDSLNTAAITKNGDLYCWGYNANGQIGNGKKGEHQLTPFRVIIGNSNVPEDNTEDNTEEVTEKPSEDNPEDVPVVDDEKVVGDTSGKASSELKIGNSVEFTVPEDVPVIGGGTVGLNFDNIPIQYEQEGNTYRIGIGISELKDLKKDKWDTFKKYVDTQKSDYKKGIDSPLASKFGTASMGWEITKPEISCYGYAEGVITNEGVQSCAGKMVIEIKGGADKEWQTTVVVVPVVIKASGEVGVETTLSLGLNFDEGYCYAKGEVALTLPQIRLSAGIGVAYVADVSVYGEMGNTVTLDTEKTTGEKHKTEVKGELTGEAGVSAKLLFASYEKPLIDGTWEYYNSKNSAAEAKSKDSLSRASFAPEKEDAYDIERVNSEWMSAKKTRLVNSPFAGEELVTLAEGTYNDTKPLIAQTADGDKVLVYTEDIENRTEGNHTAIVYSIYDNEQSAWSKPVILEDDGTADFYPSLAVKGNQVIIAWSDSNKIFDETEIEESTSLTDMAASLEVTAAVLDISTGNVEVETLSNDGYMDMKPFIAQKDGEVFISWYKNKENDIFDLSGTNEIYTASLTEGGWEEPALLTEVESPVVSVTAGYLKDEPMVAYITDEDNDQTTITDEQLMVSDLDGMSECIVKNVICANPQFAEIDGEQRLLWYEKEEDAENIYYIEESAKQPLTLLDGESDISRNYTVISGEESDLLVYEAKNSETDSKNLYGYLFKDGMASSPIQLTDVEGYIEKPSGIVTGDGFLAAVVKRNVEITEEDVVEQSDLCALEIPYDKEKLSITKLDYLPENMLPGNKTSITVSVKNDGLIDCSDGQIQVLGADGSTVLGSIELTDNLSVGEEKDYNIDIELPNNMDAADTYTVQLISSTGKTATDTFQPGFNDIKLDLEETEDEYVLSVSNKGCFDADTNLVIYDKDVDGEILGTYSLGLLEKGAAVQKTFTKEELKALGDSLCIRAENTANEEELFDFDNQLYLYVGEDIMKSLDHLEATISSTSYQVGDTLNPKDLQVVAVYSNGEEAEVSDYTTNIDSIDMSMPGEKELVITYEENYTVRTVSFNIDVSAKESGGHHGEIPDEDEKNPPETLTEEKVPMQPSTSETPAGTKISSIRLKGISKKIAAGKKITLTPVFTPRSASNKTLKWKSSNKKYATVNSKGVVTTKKKGAKKKVTITATASDGSNKKATYKISIMKHAVKSIKITSKSKKVKAGKKLALKATVKTTGKNVNKTLQWTSSNTKYATVTKKGLVKTKKAGKGKTVKITAKSTDGTKKKATVKIKIK